MRFPQEIHHFLKEHNIDSSSAQGLGGVNPARGVFTYRAESNKHSFIIKNCQKREQDVYAEHARFFIDHQIPIPKLYLNCSDGEKHWIVIEDLPHTFPKSRWYGDAEQIKALFALHLSTWDHAIHINNPYIYSSDEALLPDEWKQHFNTALFPPLCVISGDPNPTNWAIRANGELALFDFERIGNGHPAIDLAITMPGFGSEDGSLEKKIAETYIAFWRQCHRDCPFTTAELVYLIHQAKIWIGYDFLTHNIDTMEEEKISIFLEQLSRKAKTLIETKKGLS